MVSLEELMEQREETREVLKGIGADDPALTVYELNPDHGVLIIGSSGEYPDYYTFGIGNSQTVAHARKMFKNEEDKLLGALKMDIHLLEQIMEKPIENLAELAILEYISLDLQILAAERFGYRLKN